MASSRDWDELKWAWEGWRNVSGRLMPEMYEEYAGLLNMAAEMNGALNQSSFEVHHSLLFQAVMTMVHTGDRGMRWKDFLRNVRGSGSSSDPCMSNCMHMCCVN